jgi:hypothetical protein
MRIRPSSVRHKPSQGGSDADSGGTSKGRDLAVRSVPLWLTRTLRSRLFTSGGVGDVAPAVQDVQRSLDIRNPYVTIANVSSPATSYTDTGRAANTSYLYRIRARNASGVSDWSIDPAATIAFTDPGLGAGLTTVKAVHVSQLRKAVASIRLLAELPAVRWSDDPLVIGGGIRTLHITQLRSA